MLFIPAFISLLFLDIITYDKLYLSWADTSVVSSCVLYPLCVLCAFKNVGNNIKRGLYLGRIKIIKGVVTFFVFMFSSRFMLFPNLLETYTTHKGYRTHKLTTYVIDVIDVLHL